MKACVVMCMARLQAVGLANVQTVVRSYNENEEGHCIGIV
jgi:hypothetical protein